MCHLQNGRTTYHVSVRIMHVGVSIYSYVELCIVCSLWIYYVLHIIIAQSHPPLGVYVFIYVCMYARVYFVSSLLADLTRTG